MGTRRETEPNRNPGFAELFRDEFPAIHRYIGRRVGRAAADDISPATFTAAYASWDPFDGTRPVRPWLYGIAPNLLRRHHRDEERMLRAYARTGVDPVSSGDESEVVHRLDADAQRRSLALGLAELRPEEREVLLSTRTRRSSRRSGSRVSIPAPARSRAKRRVRRRSG